MFSTSTSFKARYTTDDDGFVTLPIHFSPANFFTPLPNIPTFDVKFSPFPAKPTPPATNSGNCPPIP